MGVFPVSGNKHLNKFTNNGSSRQGMMVELKCPKCGHEWKYKGELKRATCPSCGYKVKIDTNHKEDFEVNDE